jgi:hypothetical protein
LSPDFGEITTCLRVKQTNQARLERCIVCFVKGEGASRRKQRRRVYQGRRAKVEESVDRAYHDAFNLQVVTVVENDLACARGLLA